MIRDCTTDPPSFTLPDTQVIAFSTRRAYNFDGTIANENQWVRMRWVRSQNLLFGTLAIQSFSSDPNTASTAERDIIIGIGISRPTCLDYQSLNDTEGAFTRYNTQFPCVQVDGPIPGKATLSFIAGEV